jgi:pimeloyl-ACP methyl ester carboxylesterase
VPLTPPSHARRARRAIVATVGAVVAALSLSSCLVLPFLPTDDSGDPSSESTFVPQAPPAGTTGLESYYSQRLQWSKCSGGECAKLRVPIDYANPSGDSMLLAVIRSRARSTNQRLGTIVFNPGGPGASPVDYIAQSASGIVSSDVRRRFDLVGFDPRGVGRSSPIDCLGDRELDIFLGGVDTTPDTPAEEQALIAEAKTFADGCAAKNPKIIGHVSTAEAARDMDVLRAALGEPKLNYLGSSYGTFIGISYAGLFPGQMGRFVLDGPVPPDLTAQDSMEGQAKGFEIATQAYVDDCVKDPDCPVGQSRDEGMVWIRNFLKGLDSQPLPVTNDQSVTQLTEAWAATGILEAMYVKSYWSQLTKALSDARSGDGNALMKLADSYAWRTPGGQYQSNIMESIYAVNCLDKPDTADPTKVEAFAQKLSQEAPTWGRMFAWSNLPCGVWPVKATGRSDKISADGSPPIVIVGTTRDPATPYESATRMRQQLAHGALITRDGDGHTGYPRSSTCVDRAVDGWFVDGTVPQDGLKC